MTTIWHRLKFWFAMKLVALGKRWAEQALFPDPVQRARFLASERENMIRRGWRTPEQRQADAEAEFQEFMRGWKPRR